MDPGSLVQDDRPDELCEVVGQENVLAQVAGTGKLVFGFNNVVSEKYKTNRVLVSTYLRCHPSTDVYLIDKGS